MDKEKLRQSQQIISQIQDRIKLPHPEEAKFFLEKAHHSFETSQRLFDLIESESLNAQMWVINSSYYTMFFAVTALLAKTKRKITGDIGIHKHTYHAFVCYFYEKIKQDFLFDYKDAIEDSKELLQHCEDKTDIFILEYDYEIGKRKRFTYHMGEKAELSKAKTSLERARRFLLKIEEIFDSL